MAFNSLPFLLLFFPIFFIAYFALSRTRLKNLVLLAGSAVYILLAASPLTPQTIRAAALDNIPTLAAVVLVNYALGLLMQSAAHPRFWLWTGVAFNVLVLASTKLILYLQQSPAKWDMGFIPALGISYIAFQAIAYLVDIRNGRHPAERNFFDFAAFLLMFPKLLTGPIARYREVGPQLKQRALEATCVWAGLQRFTLGLAKKSLIADTLARVTTPFFRAAHPDFSTGLSWLALVAFTLQIYYDFSGYTDMAIGLGMMMGFRLPENFNRPYASLSITEFWRRWHMTLSGWFREYVFLPLEYARRRSKFFRVQTDLLVIFLLTGLWHGFNPTFAVWGLLQGAFIVFELSRPGQALKRAPILAQRAYFFAALLLSWSFFRAPSLTFAGEFLQNLLGLRRPAALPFAQTLPLPVIDPTTGLALALALIFLLPWRTWLARPLAALRSRAGFWPAELASTAFTVALLLLCLSAAAAAVQFNSIYAMF